MKKTKQEKIDFVMGFINGNKTESIDIAWWIDVPEKVKKLLKLKK